MLGFFHQQCNLTLRDPPRPGPTQLRRGGGRGGAAPSALAHLSPTQSTHSRADEGLPDSVFKLGEGIRGDVLQFYATQPPVAPHTQTVLLCQCSLGCGVSNFLGRLCKLQNHQKWVRAWWVGWWDVFGDPNCPLVAANRPLSDSGRFGGRGDPVQAKNRRGQRMTLRLGGGLGVGCLF